MKKMLAAGLLAAMTPFVNAADYVIDSAGAHASINFKVQHLGYSWLTGRFNTFDGNFSYDVAKPEQASINVNIDTNSLDSNHADRDKHLKSGDFLNTAKFPKARFVSTSIKDLGNGKLEVKGDLTLHGVTKAITIDAEKIGEGSDPWGGYRAGFAGTTKFKMADFGIDYNLGPASTHVELNLHVEGVKQ